MAEFKRVTLYKVKAVDGFQDFLKGNLNAYDRIQIDENVDGYIKYQKAGGTEKTEDAIPWLRFLNSGFDEKQYTFTAHNVFPRAIMALRIATDGTNMFYAATFGQHGDSFLDKEKIVYDFGIKVGMNICGDEGLRRVQTTAHEAISKQTERQTSSGTTLGIFGINSDSEFLRTISGWVKPEYSSVVETFRGKDSISIKFPKDSDVSWNYLVDVCRRFEERYRSDDYKHTEFKSYDTLRHESDPVVIAALDNALAASIEARNFDRIHLAPPEFIEVEDLSFAYAPGKGDNLPPTFDDLRIGDLVGRSGRHMRGLTVDTLKRWKIYRFDPEEQRTFEEWNAYRCIVAEIDLDSRTFVLSNGQWREVSLELKQTVDSFFAATDLTLEPDYLPEGVEIWSEARRENREEVYNLAAANNGAELYLLDKAKITIAGRKTYEVCDLLHLDRSIIHVKRYSAGAASISHLFTQGKFYAHAFSTDEACRTDMAAWIEDDEGNVNAGKDKAAFKLLIPDDVDERQYTVVFCILHDRDRFSLADIPFMSRYELMLSHRFLTRDRKFKVGVVLRRIRLGGG